MLMQLLKELLPFISGKPRRIFAALAVYAISATHPESYVTHPVAVSSNYLVIGLSVLALLWWLWSEFVAVYRDSPNRAVPYHEFQQFHTDQLLANEEAAELLVRLHVLLSADDDTTLADRVVALEAHTRQLDAQSVRMLNAIPTPYYETNATGGLTVVNEAFAELYNTTPRTIIRNGTDPYIHQEDVEKVCNRWRAAIAAQSGYTVEFRVSIRGTVRRELRVTGFPMHDDNKVFKGHYGYVEVISDVSNTDS